MSPTGLLLATFLISLTGLFAFIWSLRKGLFDIHAEGAKVIFDVSEVGRVEDPSGTSGQRQALQSLVDEHGDADEDGPIPTSKEEAEARIVADRSTSYPAFIMLACAVVWLILGSLAGLVSSLKLHAPDLLTSYEWLSFGRLRTLHLNIVAYGWAPFGLLGLAIWLLPRLLRTPLVGGRYALFGVVLWNAGLIAGLGAIASGQNSGMEWLEITWQIGILLALGGMMIGVPMVLTLQRRKVDHLYVSVWYMGAALFWFPVLYLVAKMPGIHVGIEYATMNWWYGHNVLGLFYTPLALACIYYFLPKVIGRPVRSYNLSLLGFWTLAFFYGQVGGHHLIGGPIPEWMITLSIVQSFMMIIPVVAFSVNQHYTLKGHVAALKHSPTLRFIVFGAIMYTVVSLQGSFEALRSLNAITHFTHFTVAHAHLGMYGFMSMVMFGGMYFAMPRIVDRPWPYPALIAAHFWLVVAGFTIYIVGLSIGGILQGLTLLDGSIPFIESVKITAPWLQSRSVGGTLMTLGHIVFAVHFALMVVAGDVRRPTLSPSSAQPVQQP